MSRSVLALPIVPVSRRRRSPFAASAARASSSASGATTTSVKRPAMARAVAPSSGRLAATTPPKALTGSQARAFS